MPVNKSLARQVFPPGLVGDLMYKATQMMPMNAFANRMLPQPQPIQQQQPQAQMGQPSVQQLPPHMMPPNGMPNPDLGTFQGAGQPMSGALPARPPMQQMPPNMGPQMLPASLPQNQNIFAQRMARY